MRGGSVLRGFCPRGVSSQRGFVLGGFVLGGFVLEGFCPTPVAYTENRLNDTSHVNHGCSS